MEAKKCGGGESEEEEERNLIHIEEDVSRPNIESIFTVLWLSKLWILWIPLI